MFIESKKAYAICKAIEAAAAKDDADNFSICKTREGLAISFDMCFGYGVFADNAMEVVERNDLNASVCEYAYGDGRSIGYAIRVDY